MLRRCTDPSLLLSAVLVMEIPPAVDLDIEEIERRLDEDEYDRRLLELRTQEARIARSVSDESRLRLYLRYGLRPNDTGIREQGVSGGLTFRLPLFQGADAGLEAEVEAAR